MTITLSADLEKVILQKARDEGITPEAVVHRVLREKLGAEPSALATIGEPRDEWEKRLLSLGTPCGVSVSDGALSSEGLYD